MFEGKRRTTTKRDVAKYLKELMTYTIPKCIHNLGPLIERFRE